MTGLRLNLGCGPHLLDGFENLDPATGWRFEDGLPYPDGSVEGISISHSLHRLPLAAWPAAFAEIARVLEPGGIVRVTDDDREHPESPRRTDPWHEAVAATGPEVVRVHLRAAGLKTRLWTATMTGFRDDSLLQAWHGLEPKVFFLEGKKS